MESHSYHTELEELARTELDKIILAVKTLESNYQKSGDSRHKSDVDKLVQTVTAIKDSTDSDTEKYLKAGIALASAFNEAVHKKTSGLKQKAGTLFGLRPQKINSAEEKLITHINEHPKKSHYTRMLGLIVKNRILEKQAIVQHLLENNKEQSINQNLVAEWEGHLRGANAAKGLKNPGTYTMLEESEVKIESPRKNS